MQIAINLSLVQVEFRACLRKARGEMQYVLLF
jgi:hypothetical protein